MLGNQAWGMGNEQYMNALRMQQQQQVQQYQLQRLEPSR